VVTRLNTEVNKILRNPEIRAKLTGMGAIVMRARRGKSRPSPCPS
jgi:hypothetical protein